MASLLPLLLLMVSAEGPEQFLQDLCEHRYGAEGALFWAGSRSPGPGGEVADPDSLAILLEPLRDLSVEPGPRTRFEDTGEGYLIEYGESRWTWTTPDGRVRTTEGLTCLLWRDGGYFWTEVPVLADGAPSAGLRERLLAGLLFTGLILGFGVLAVIWARRRRPAGG